MLTLFFSSNSAILLEATLLVSADSFDFASYCSYSRIIILISSFCAPYQFTLQWTKLLIVSSLFVFQFLLCLLLHSLYFLHQCLSLLQSCLFNLSLNPFPMRYTHNHLGFAYLAVCACTNSLYAYSKLFWLLLSLGSLLWKVTPFSASSPGWLKRK